MSDPVGSVTSTQTPAATKSPATPRESAPRSVPTDTVQLTSAAQAALQEMLETTTQTAQEASKGDIQAQRLLAKEEAQKEASAKEEVAKTATAAPAQQTSVHVIA